MIWDFRCQMSNIWLMSNVSGMISDVRHLVSDIFMMSYVRFLIYSFKVDRLQIILVAKKYISTRRNCSSCLICNVIHPIADVRCSMFA